MVTGADGFIGSHLAEQLAIAGAEVRALALYNSFNSWGWLEGSPALDRVEVVTGDIRDAHFCLDVVQGVDVVFHLAALIPIPYSYRAPDSYVDTNIRGTLNLCQASLRAGVSRFIQTSTSEVYGTAQYVPIDEQHPLQPQSPYSATKIGADAVALSFHHAFQLPVVVARPFNTYGPRQSARAVIPSIIAQVAQGREEIQLGELTTTRDFTYVSDTCTGFQVLASLTGAEGQAFNIGTGTEISIGALAQLIGQVMGVSLRITQAEERMRPATSEVFRLCCDPGKLRAASGFMPTISLEDGLRRTVEWFRQRENLERYKGGLYNV